jgi:cysteine desulfurase
MKLLPVYMDHHATTPVDPRVFEAMRPYFTEAFGNAASRSHRFGWEAAEAVETARGRIAALIGADPKEIIFTSGATEADNLAIKGVAEMSARDGRHIITTAIEHKAVLDTGKRLERNGYEVTYLPVDRFGRVTAEQVRSAIRTGEKGTAQRTILISVMAANNEIGTLQPIAEIGRVAKDAGVLFHSDAVQALGKVPVDVQAAGIDLMSLTAHKLYGPKGCGALYVRRQNPRVRLAAQMDGGGHERGLRSGTLPVPLIVGFGAACEIAGKEMTAESARLLALRRRLHEGITSQLEGVTLNGHPTERLPGNLNLAFAGVSGEALLMQMKDVAVSSGAACTSATLEPSHVLRALGLGDEPALSSIRYGLGRFNTAEEVDYVAGQTVQAVRNLRELSPRYAAANAGVSAAP